jgi:hypothetical protein
MTRFQQYSLMRGVFRKFGRKGYNYKYVKFINIRNGANKRAIQKPLTPAFTPACLLEKKDLS